MVTVVGDLVGRERHAERPALRVGERAYSYREFCTSARRTGNFLAHHGVVEGRTVGVAEARRRVPLLAFLGTALLGGRVRFAPDREVEARAVVAPAEALPEYDLPPGGKRVGYGAAPADPSDVHFEAGVWSENPGFPDVSTDPDAPLLLTGGARFSHAALLEAARGVVDDAALDPDDEVALRAPLSDPGAVVAGVLAPLLAGATVLFSRGEPGAGTGTGTVAVGDGPETRAVDPADARPTAPSPPSDP